VISSVPLAQTFIDTAYRYQMHVSDQDGDALIYQLHSDIEGMTLTENGLLNWRPTQTQAGDHSVIISVSDGFSLIQQIYTLNVALNIDNKALVEIVSVPNLHVVLGKTYQYQVKLANNQVVTYQLTTAPEGMLIS
jgi:hypothetical protein